MRSRCLYLLVILALVGCQNKKADPQTAPVVMPKNDPRTSTPELSGSIKGKPFKPDQVNYEERKLSFRMGKDFFADMEIWFALPQSDDPKLEGKEWKYGGDHFGSPVIQLSVREGQPLPSTDFAFPNDYTMTLKITKQTSKSLEGSLDLRVGKPGNTHLTGTFTATIKKMAADPPDADDAPYVRGKIIMVGNWQKESLSAGFVGKGTNGKDSLNLAGTNFSPAGSEFATSETFKPQLTSISNHATNGLGYKHVKMAPGDYNVYVRRGEVVAAWKKVTVKEGDQLTVDLTIDPAKMGSVVVTLPDEEANDKTETILSLVPLEFDRFDIPFDMWIRNACKVADVKMGNKTVTIDGIPAGKYRAVRGKSEAEVEVVAGKKTAGTLVRNVSKKK